MTISSSPRRGPFFDLNDTKLDLGPCAFCGKSENTDVISRVRCENCGKVVCWECADCGVHSSLHDFQSFVYREPAKGDEVFLPSESCPTCQETSWWEKHTSKPEKLHAGEHAEGINRNPSLQGNRPGKVLEHRVNRHNLEEVKALRREIVKIARDILDAKTGIVEGARLIFPLGHSLPEIESLPEFVVIKAILSETDHLPAGKESGMWNDAVLQAKKEELHEIENRYSEKVFPACTAIIKKCEEPI